MLGKLLKHEFTATGRQMLPMFGVLAGLVVLANISVLMLQREIGGLLALLFIFVLIATFIAVIVAELMPIIVMVIRFYKNLLRDEGYLMHTLPVSVHELIWSKLIVSLVWFLATNLAIFLLGGLSALFQSGTDLGEIFRSFPSLAELQEMVPEITRLNVTGFALEFAAALILAGIVTCLHFYAAMSLGHMFSKDKVLYSILFFIAIDIVFNVIGNLLGAAGVYAVRTNVQVESLEQAIDSLNAVLAVIGSGLVLLAIRGAILYVLTVLGLRKGLNLA